MSAQNGKPQYSECVELLKELTQRASNEGFTSLVVVAVGPETSFARWTLKGSHLMALLGALEIAKRDLMVEVE